jgi:hypothetical protein
VLGVGVLGPLAAPAHQARAQTASEIATARQWFAEGLAHEEKTEYAPALEFFRRAVQVKKTPQIVYHVGFCESRTGALVEALVDLDNAATLARAAHMDNVVSAAQSELADVNTRIPSLEVHVQGDATPSRFVVDGSAIALSMLRSKMPLDPGEHTVTIEFTSGTSATKKTTLAERDAKSLELSAPAGGAVAATPSPAVVPTPAEPTPPPPASDEPTHRSSPVLAWTLVGVGGAAAIGGAVIFLAAQGKASTLNDACPSHTACDPSLSGTYNSAKTLDTVGLTLGAVGIAAAGIGVSMLLLRPSASTSTALVVTPRGFDLTTRF